MNASICKILVLNLLLVAFVCLTTEVAYGQQATVTGRVTDQTEAVVPGAQVTIANVETKITNTVTTNDEGYYTLPPLQPGDYDLTVEATNFQSVRQKNLRLNVQQVARLDFTLQAGQVSESVEITAGAQLTEPESGALGTVIENKRINELPLNGRNPLELARLTPNVNLQATAFNDSRNFNLVSMSINGGPPGSNAIHLDGSSATLPERNEYSVSPNVDAVQEFKVHTNSYSAELGLTGGGVINLVTKSGTNDFHGSLFEFVRNDALDANRWDFNRLVDPATGRGRAKAKLRYNQFGGSVGGPIILPRFGEGGPATLNGRNRSFFFFNYEGLRFKTASLAQTRVPTPAERRGDFSNTFIVDPSNSRNFLPVRLFDPATAEVVAGRVTRQPFASADLSNLSNRFDPVALRVLQFYPLPNQPALDLSGRNNYVGVVDETNDADQFNVRLDHQFSQANKLYGRYSQNNATVELPGTFPQSNIANPGGAFQFRNNKNAVIGDTHIFSPTLFNEVRFSISRQSLLSAPAGYGQNAPTLIGLPMLPDFVFPRFNIGGMSALGNAVGFLAIRGLTVGQVTDTVTLIRGKHNIKAGVDLRNNFRNDFSPGQASGQFNFNADLTNDPTTNATERVTGFGLATFLLGAVSGGNLSVGIAKAEAFREYGVFIQDDFKMHPRLTLNLGLRYDLITPSTERFNRYSNFSPTVTNPVVNAPGALQFAGIDFDRYAHESDRNNFGPRFGFAYDVFGDTRTIVRGGYGVFYYHNAIKEYPETQGFSAVTNFAREPSRPAFQLQNGPTTIIQPPGSSRGPLSFLGDNVTYVETERATSYVQQWNLGIQRELPYKVLLEVGYAGSRGNKLFTESYDFNQLDPRFNSLGNALNDTVPNPYFALLPVGSLLRTQNITRRQSLRPYPYYGDIMVLNPHHGNTIYHSFQVKVEKRFTQGLSFLLAYTGSKKIGDTGRGVTDNTTGGGPLVVGVGCGQATKYDRQPCRSIEPEDIPRNLVTSFVYELPFGRGKRFLSNGLLSAIFGNFQTNGILAYRSGLPLIIRGASNGGTADRPNQIRSAKLPKSERSAERWFDTTAFVSPAQFTLGNAPRTQPDLRGPEYLSLDFSLFKNIPFGEGKSVQLRSEFFNVTNRANLGLPDTNFLSSGFGTITSGGGSPLDPRRIQLGVKFYF